MCIEADCKIPALLIKDKALKSATQQMLMHARLPGSYYKMVF